MKNGEKENPKWVYNFVFPDRCHQLNVNGYIFRRVPEYIERVQSLQHLISSFSEFDRPMNTGKHAITANLTLPEKEKKPVIVWGENDATALNDILLLLSLFTHRDVFALPEGEAIVVGDPREYFFGLGSAMAYEEGQDEYGNTCDVGFQKNIESVYERMLTVAWQKEYGRGRFLPLFRSVCRRQILETQFILSWTIWEILFMLHNQSWLSEEQIIKLPASEKISYILTRYQIKKTLDENDRKGLKRFVKIRNALVHAGRFLDGDAIHDAALFVRVTVIIIAQILGLSGPDVLYSAGSLSDRLMGRKVTPVWDCNAIKKKR